MAYTELQTAATRLIHVTQPTDRDLHYLQREFHLTPDDAEAVLGVTNDSTIQTQPGYHRLILQWPLITRRGMAITEIHCFVGTGWLVIIDHGDVTMAAELMNELRTVPPERLWVDRPMMILYELLRRAIRALNAGHYTLTGAHRQALARTRSHVAEILRNFTRTYPDQDPTMIQSWRWLAFTLIQADQATVHVPVATTTRLPLTAKGYAAASAAVVIATLLVISKTL